MQAVFEFIAGLLAALASLAFAQFGATLHGKCTHAHASSPPEVTRTLRYLTPGPQALMSRTVPVQRRRDRA